MKRFAAHRVYFALHDELCVMQVVELDDAGKVASIFPLLEEVRNTEWIGGVIIVASKKPEYFSGGSFADFCHQLHHLEIQAASEVFFAYHITQFDVAGMKFTPASQINSL